MMSLYKSWKKRKLFGVKVGFRVVGPIGFWALGFEVLGISEVWAVLPELGIYCLDFKSKSEGLALNAIQSQTLKPSTSSTHLGDAPTQQGYLRPGFLNKRWWI